MSFFYYFGWTKMMLLANCNVIIMTEEEEENDSCNEETLEGWKINLYRGRLKNLCIKEICFYADEKFWTYFSLLLWLYIFQWYWYNLQDEHHHHHHLPANYQIIFSASLTIFPLALAVYSGGNNWYVCTKDNHFIMTVIIIYIWQEFMGAMPLNPCNFIHFYSN